MVRTAVLGVLVALAGCHLALPLQGGADLADDGPGNEAGPDAAVQDSAGDGVVATIVFVGEVPTDLPIGSHVVLQLSVSPAGAQVDAKLAARPCLLKRKGQGQGPTGEVELSLPAGSPGAELVIFAPPAAPPTGSCTITSVAPGPAIQPLTFTVKPPGYVVKNIGDHAITVIEGMEVMTVGKLVGTWWPVQALTFAGGVFGGRWVAVTGDNGDQTVTPSTVGFYSFSAGDSGDLSPWLDLTGKATNPTAVEDTVWSPQGPCPLGPDALYVAGPGADAALKPGDDKGGVYCVDPGKNVAVIHDNAARTLDVELTGAFHPAMAAGTLLVSRWGGHYSYPDGSTFSDPALPAVANLFRFARGGPHKGQLYAIAGTGGTPYPLTRVTPAPHSEVELVGGLTNSNASIAMSHGGAFGEMLVVTDDSPSAAFGLWDLVALFEEAGGVRTLQLAGSLQCGRRIAFDAAGLHLAVVTASTSCGGESIVHLLHFPLP